MPSGQILEAPAILWKKSVQLAMFSIPLWMPIPGRTAKPIPPSLPLREVIGIHVEEDQIPDDLLDATSLRVFLQIYTGRAREALAAFDEIFGERA